MPECCNCEKPSVAWELGQLHRQVVRGAVTQEEFDDAKTRLLGSYSVGTFESISDEISQLHRQLKLGTVSEGEFSSAKATLLNRYPDGKPVGGWAVASN